MSNRTLVTLISCGVLWSVVSCGGNAQDETSLGTVENCVVALTTVDCPLKSSKRYVSMDSMESHRYDTADKAKWELGLKFQQECDRVNNIVENEAAQYKCRSCSRGDLVCAKEFHLCDYDKAMNAVFFLGEDDDDDGVIDGIIGYIPSSAVDAVYWECTETSDICIDGVPPSDDIPEECLPPAEEETTEEETRIPNWYMGPCNHCEPECIEQINESCKAMNYKGAMFVNDNHIPPNCIMYCFGPL